MTRAPRHGFWAGGVLVDDEVVPETVPVVARGGFLVWGARAGFAVLVTLAGLAFLLVLAAGDDAWGFGCAGSSAARTSPVLTRATLRATTANTNRRIIPSLLPQGAFCVAGFFVDDFCMLQPLTTLTRPTSNTGIRTTLKNRRMGVLLIELR